MKFNIHRNLEGMHAIFSPSQSHWLRYDDEKVLQVYANRKAAELGTRLHRWAKETIDLGIKQSKSNKTLCRFVNDAIGFRMSTEVVLFYSENCFGTADAISFNDGILRIHDLKTGSTGTIDGHFEQLEVYAALFCLEYNIKPKDITIELRVYKNDEMFVHKPDPEDIETVMDIIVHHDELVSKVR